MLVIGSSVFRAPQGSVFQPGFREWLPGLPPKQTEIAWDEICDHSSMPL